MALSVMTTPGRDNSFFQGRTYTTRAASFDVQFRPWFRGEAAQKGVEG